MVQAGDLVNASFLVAVFFGKEDPIFSGGLAEDVALWVTGQPDLFCGIKTDCSNEVCF